MNYNVATVGAIAVGIALLAATGLTAKNARVRLARDDAHMASLRFSLSKLTMPQLIALDRTECAGQKRPSNSTLCVEIARAVAEPDLQFVPKRFEPVVFFAQSQS